MFLRQFIVTSIIVSVSYASEENNSDITHNNLEFVVNEGSPFEVKMLAGLSVMKLDILDKLDILEKNDHNFEENIRGKLHRLENSILDKLEEYIDGKLNSLGRLMKSEIDSLERNMNYKVDALEKNMNHRLDALEKNIPDKSDIIPINRKFDALKKNYTVSGGMFTSESKISYETLSKMNAEVLRLEENINQKLNAIEKNIVSLKGSVISKENTSSKLYTLNDTFAQKTLDEENLTNKDIQLNRTSEFNNYFDFC